MQTPAGKWRGAIKRASQVVGENNQHIDHTICCYLFEQKLTHIVNHVTQAFNKFGALFRRCWEIREDGRRVI
uniref:hypothetical protein n=1 Tax=Neorhizobium sp. EC2-8 TaxID=3129230 RepID=UPI003100D6FC